MYYKATAKGLCILALVGGNALMAQQTPDANRDSSVNSSQSQGVSEATNQVGGLVNSSSSAAVSAAVTASAESTEMINALEAEVSQSKGKREEQRFPESTSPSSEMGGLNGAGGSTIGLGAQGIRISESTSPSSAMGGLNGGREPAIGMGPMEIRRRGFGTPSGEASTFALPGMSNASERSGIGTAASSSVFGIGGDVSKGYSLENGASGGQSNSAAHPGAKTEEDLSYSEGFPDSTRGTALLSPLDPGTRSPLDWSTDLDFGFADFEEQEFLAPTLLVSKNLGGHHGVGQSEKAKLKLLKRLQRLQLGAPGATTPSSLEPSLTTMPELNDLSQPSLESPLVQSPLGP